MFAVVFLPPDNGAHFDVSLLDLHSGSILAFAEEVEALSGVLEEESIHVVGVRVPGNMPPGKVPAFW